MCKNCQGLWPYHREATARLACVSPECKVQRASCSFTSGLVSMLARCSGFFIGFISNPGGTISVSGTLLLLCNSGLSRKQLAPQIPSQQSHS